MTRLLVSLVQLVSLVAFWSVMLTFPFWADGPRTSAQPPTPEGGPRQSQDTALVKSAANEATIAVLKEQVDRLREDVRGAVGHLQAIQARFDALSQTYYPRNEAEQARKLDATPERLASLSARMDALEGRVNSYGDRLVGYALVGGLGLAGGGAIYHFSKGKGGSGDDRPGPPPGFSGQALPPYPTRGPATPNPPDPAGTSNAIK